MGSKPKEAVFSVHVDECLKLRAKIESLKAELKAAENKLIESGPGRYQNEEGEICVVVSATQERTAECSYAIPDGDSPLDAAKNIAGDSFAKLFERKITYDPCEGFASVVPKLLTPARARAMLELCVIPGNVTSAKRAYVKYA